MVKKSVPEPRLTKLSVYLYIPNIIGYIRVLMNCYAFAICFSNKRLFSLLYFVSFVCDGVDGWCARKFNQVSTFGAVLDMVTDRISTACLLVILSQVYRPGLIFLSLLALDIGSHWLQMYSTFLLGKASHKDVKDSTSWLFKAYYGNRMIMAYCCVACEVLYIILFLVAKNETENLFEVLMGLAQHNTPLSVIVGFVVIGWAIKQAVNCIQVEDGVTLVKHCKGKVLMSPKESRRPKWSKIKPLAAWYLLEDGSGTKRKKWKRVESDRNMGGEKVTTAAERLMKVL